MHVTQVSADGSVQLGDEARRLGYRPGQLIEVIVSSARGTLILALHDMPVTTEVKAVRLPVPKDRHGTRALAR